MMGWQCPSCGQTYSPFVEKCGNCAPKAIGASSTQPYPPHYWPPGSTGRPLPPLPENTCG